MNDFSYKPINCSFYDILEAAATNKELCKIVIRLSEGELAIKDFIRTFIVKDKVEYLILKSGIEVRLDAISSVNGNSVGSFC